MIPPAESKKTAQSDETDAQVAGENSGRESEHVPPTGNASADNDNPREFGGRGGLEPTRYGDWEKNGRCIDF